MKVTCEVEVKQWLEVFKCIVHVMTCLHLYLILVIVSGYGKKWQLAKRQNLSLEECCITCENHLLAQDKIHSMQANFYLSDMITIHKTHEQIIFRSNIFNMMRKMVCTLYAFLMRFLCVSIFSASSNQPSALLSKFKQLNWTYISSKNNYYIDLF